jgi:Protein of unknown function (DUF2934)
MNSLNPNGRDVGGDRGYNVGGGDVMKPAKAMENNASRMRTSVIEPDDDMSVPTHEAIANLAYTYWESRGGQGGSPWDDWFRAEQELLRRKEI